MNHAACSGHERVGIAVDQHQLDALASRLNAARRAEMIPAYADASVEGVWKAEPNKCHENASTWAEANDGWTAVRGWLVFDLTKAFLIPRPVVHFITHSIVRDPDGKLWDITPAEVSQQYPFLPHPGTDAEFVRLIEVHKLSYVDYFPPE